MTKVSGLLGLVTDKPAHVSEVWVRAPKARTYIEGVVTTGNDRVPVTNGEVSFEVVPGPAALTLVAQGEAVDVIPILVGDVAEQTLRQVVSAAEVADDATQREIERLAAQAVELIDSSTENARRAQDGATRAETAASRAASSQEAARINESASWSARNQSSTHASNAGRSAAEASADAGKAAKSASAAADSASVAKSEADRAATIAGSTKWVGTKLEVNGKLSPDLKGEKGDKGDTGARGAQGPRGPQGDLGPKGDKGDPGKDGTMRFEDLTAAQRESLRGKDGAPGTTSWSGLTGKPSTFTPAAHSHTLKDVEGLLARFGSGDAPTATEFNSVAVGSKAAAGKWSIALGANTSAAANVSAALGYNASAGGEWSMALGPNSTASNNYSQALTAYSKATKNRHTVIGIDATDENIPTNVVGTVVIGKDGAPVYLAGVDVVTELNALKAQVEAQPKVQVVSSVPANPDPNTLYLIG